MCPHYIFHIDIVVGCVAMYISVTEQQPHTLNVFALLIGYCADAILCNGQDGGAF